MRNLDQNIVLNVTALDSPEVADACAKVRLTLPRTRSKHAPPLTQVSVAQGFTWGTPPSALLEPLSADSSRKFDLVLLSDLVFNHSQHAALLASCLSCLAPRPSAPHPPPASSPTPTQPPIDLSRPETLRAPAVLCFFSHHRPWLAEADLGILELAREAGWVCEKVWEDPEAGVRRPFRLLSLPSSILSLSSHALPLESRTLSR